MVPGTTGKSTVLSVRILVWNTGYRYIITGDVLVQHGISVGITGMHVRYSRRERQRYGTLYDCCTNSTTSAFATEYIQSTGSKCHFVFLPGVQ
jgi:hypothetical protein